MDTYKIIIEEILSKLIISLSIKEPLKKLPPPQLLATRVSFIRNSF